MELSRKIPRVYKDLHKPARYKFIYGGRGSGKSHDRAEALIELSAIKKIDAVCIREVQKSLNQSVKKLLEIKIEVLGLGHLFEVQEATIKSINGGQIIFQGMQNHTAESIKSLEGFDIAWIEEAQSISQRSLDLLRPTIRKEGSEIWATWNPNNESDPIDQLARGSNPPPNSILVEANYMHNPFMPKTLMDEMEYDKGRDFDKYRHIWLGEYISLSNARVFKNWVVEDFTRPLGTIYRLGADWGFANDPTCIVRVSLDGNRLYIDYEASMVGCEIVNTPDLFRQVPESDKWFITADSSRPETISHMKKNGFPKISPSEKGPGSIEDGVEFLKSFDIVVHPRCTHVINELTYYKYKQDPLTEKILPVFEDKNNHMIDAIRYACEAVRKKAQIYNTKLDYSRLDSMVV